MLFLRHSILSHIVSELTVFIEWKALSVKNHLKEACIGGLPKELWHSIFIFQIWFLCFIYLLFFTLTVKKLGRFCFLFFSPISNLAPMIIGISHGSPFHSHYISHGSLGWIYIVGSSPYLRGDLTHGEFSRSDPIQH